MRRSLNVLLLALLATTGSGGIAMAGDEDQEPAYKIYIDPETGKYTTEDPEAAAADNVAAVPAAPATPGPAGPGTGFVVAGAVIALVAGGLIWLQQHKQVS